MNKKSISLIVILILISQIISGFSFAEYSRNTQNEKTISLHDLGLLQLAAHDFFNVDRETEIDHENGKLDLSTLFDHGEENIPLGGEPRNRENIILFSVASKYGEKYVRLVDVGFTEELAKKYLIYQYHKDLRRAYFNTFKEKMPGPRSGDATMTENLAFRSIHDLLPGAIVVDGVEMMTLDHSLVGKKLDRNELRQRSGACDGEIDQVFRNIEIFIPPDTFFTIDLHERDSSFAKQFGTDFTFEYFLSELNDGTFDKDEQVMKQIRSLFSKGLKLNSVGKKHINFN